MPAEVLERVRSEIEDRLAVLSGAVSEARELEIALVALEEVPVASRPAGDPGHARRRRKAARGVHARKGRRRRGTTVGVNDQTVLDSLRGLTEALDIKAVMGKTGLSQHRASYTLKKLAGEGLLTQSSVAGGRGMPKLVFVLASSPETIAPAAPKRKARQKARRRSKAPASATGN